MNVNELKTSNFLKRTDVGDGTIVTIRAIDQQNVAQEGAPEELKYCLHVDEFDKAMVLNSTNGQLIAHALKSEESEDWIGRQIILFDDPSVSFGGKLVGGIRVRPVARAAAAPPARTSTPPSQRPAQASAASGAQSSKNKLKLAFKAAPGFGSKFSADDINIELQNKFGVNMDGLSEAQAEEAFQDFDGIIQRSQDNIPF